LILKLFDYFEDNIDGSDYYFIATEYADGDSLDNYLAK
jgi:hypothetical protein